MTVKTVNLYTGSSYPKHNAEFAERAKQATINIAKLAGQFADVVQYGGGTYGHLQDVTDAVGSVGGKLRALIPPAFYDPDEEYPDHVEVVLVQSDWERQKKFLEADAHIATPGGDGTGAEIFIAHNDNLSKLYAGQEGSPVVVYNLDDRYRGLKAYFNDMKEDGYSNEDRQKYLHFETTEAGVIKRIWPSAKF